MGRYAFIKLLTLMFVAAKLMGLIDWSWWWVFSPVLIVIALICISIVVGTVIVALQEAEKGK